MSSYKLKFAQLILYSENFLFLLFSFGFELVSDLGEILFFMQNFRAWFLIMC